MQEKQPQRLPARTVSPAQGRTFTRGTSVGGHSLLTALRCHWPEYVMEGAELGLYILAACMCGVLFQYPASPIHQVLPDPILLVISRKCCYY